MKHIFEYLINRKLTNKDWDKKYKYHPKTKKELIDAINIELIKYHNTNLNRIDTSNIDDMSGLFAQGDETGIQLTIKEQETLDVSGWDTHNVTNMGYMFNGCLYFDGDISEWDVSNVEDMANMFEYCAKFNCDISNWKPEKLKYSSGMFLECKAFNQPLYDWNLTTLEDADNMFEGCENFNQDLSSWDVSNASVYDMFIGCGIDDKYLPKGLYE